MNSNIFFRIFKLLIDTLNALWAKEGSQKMTVAWLEKTNKKYFCGKYCFLWSKPLWEDLTTINIFPAWGMDWVMMLLNQICVGLNTPKQKYSPSPLVFCVYHRLWISLHSCPPCSNPQFIAVIEWNRCQYHLSLKICNVSGVLKRYFVMFCTGFCKHFS